MMIEIMAAALSGGQFSFEVDWSRHEGAAIPLTGQFVMLIDPKAGHGAFADRVEQLIAQVMDAGVERLPGDRRYAARRAAAETGIPLGEADWAALQRLGG